MSQVKEREAILKMRSFLAVHQLGASAYSGKYDLMVPGFFAGTQKAEWGVNRVQHTASGIKAFLGIYSKHNTQNIFTFSKQDYEGDGYQIDYDLGKDSILSIRKNEQEVKDSHERDLILQSCIDDMYKPSLETIERAKVARIKDTFNEEIKKQNRILISVGIVLSSLALGVGMPIIGGAALIIAGLIIGVTCILGSRNGLFDTSIKREERLELLFEQHYPQSTQEVASIPSAFATPNVLNDALKVTPTPMSQTPENTPSSESINPAKKFT